MHLIQNVWFISLSCVIARVAVVVYGNKTPSASNQTPIKIPTQDSHTSQAIKSLEATLEKKFDQLIAVISAGSRGNASIEPDGPFASCKDIYASQTKSKENKDYMLQMDSGKIPVYCHMTSHGIGACGGGGWTLVLKIDGEKKTFHYDSKLWSNKNEFNLPGGKTGFDTQETKLPSYWNTSFSKICLGMKIGQQINFIVINKQADSLYSLIADGQYRATSLGRDMWKMLIGSEASLQQNCNREGFNAACNRSGASRARIGITVNNENDCSNCDSRLGFGTGGYQDNSNTCGNVARFSPDNGEKYIKTMGYILVQ